MSTALFRKWRRWLARILDEQLSELLVSQHIFQQLVTYTAPYAGTYRSGELVLWMKQGYIASAAMGIRRMLEEPAKPPKSVYCNCGRIIVKSKPQKSLSLVVLLRDIEECTRANPSLFSRSYFRKRYIDRSIPVRFADRAFGKITRNRRASTLSASRVRKDIDFLLRIAQPVRRLANKVVAHTSWDRRKIGRPKFSQLDAAIHALAEVYRLYALLVVGSYPTPLVPFDSHNVTAEFKKIWPPQANHIPPSYGD